ncbi:hypothetical protein EKG83_34795 [Saccharothrix syringae]|uniref:DUF6292 domain-containing protein n=1 Tax=Saccharothrix syringae TaxID=103733 RepID=A0A5Q0HFQ7_SACSY|nr:hypothetical protein EKG83_34795 [Saccharothrix syringae]
MLPEDDAGVLATALAGYVRAVAAEVGVPPEGTEFEVSDTTTAYLALAEGAGRDLMLVWSSEHGWSVAVETDPGEQPVTVAHLGPPLVPRPAEVARFVADVRAGGPGRPELTVAEDRRLLVERLSAYL